MDASCIDYVLEAMIEYIVTENVSTSNYHVMKNIKSVYQGLHNYSIHGLDKLVKCSELMAIIRSPGRFLINFDIAVQTLGEILLQLPEQTAPTSGYHVCLLELFLFRAMESYQDSTTFNECIGEINRLSGPLDCSEVSDELVTFRKVCLAADRGSRVSEKSQEIHDVFAENHGKERVLNILSDLHQFLIQENDLPRVLCGYLGIEEEEEEEESESAEREGEEESGEMEQDSDQESETFSFFGNEHVQMPLENNVRQEQIEAETGRLRAKMASLPEKLCSTANKTKETSSRRGSLKAGRWTAEEEEYFIKRVREIGVGKWREMMDSERLPGRTNVHLKDKWRNLVKKGVVSEQDFE